MANKDLVPKGKMTSTPALIQPNQLDDLFENLTPDEQEGYTETKDPIVYVGIRQKDLMVGGKVERAKGAFKFGSTKEPTEPDVDTLTGVVLVSTPVRTRFENPQATKPICGSSDNVTAEPWGYKASSDSDAPMHCEFCPFNKHGKNFDGNNEKSCRENLQLYMYELTRREVICLQFTPGGWRPWADFSARIMREVRQGYYKKNPAGKQAPTVVPWHRFVIDVKVKYIDRNGGYYAPDFYWVTMVEKENVESIKQDRQALMEGVLTQAKEAAAGGAGLSGEDVMGEGQPPLAKEAEFVEEDI